MFNNFFNNPAYVIALGTIFAIIIAGFVFWRIKRNKNLEERAGLGGKRESFNIIPNKYEKSLPRLYSEKYDTDIDQTLRTLGFLQSRYLEDPSEQHARELYRAIQYVNRKTHNSPIASRKNKIVEEKRNKFLNVPSVSFHYANKDQINSFYNDYFKEPTIASLVSEISGEINGEVKGSLPQILEAKLGSKDLSKWISTIKLPETSLNGMFLRYQRETINSEQVTLGLEEVEIELTELQAFDDSVAEFQKRFEFTLEGELVEEQRSHLKEKAAGRTLTKLEQATGWVLVEGRFKIELEGEFYKCTYVHPVNDYLSNQVGPITVSVLIPIESIEAHIAGNYRQSIGRLIPMRIYGQVWQPIDRQTNIWTYN